MNVKIIEDMSKISTIPKLSLDKLVDIQNSCISHAVLEAIQSNESIIEANIGIGVIKICLSDEEIKYSFTPSVKLNSSILDCINNNRDQLDTQIECALRDRILNHYKDLI